MNNIFKTFAFFNDHTFKALLYFRDRDLKHLLLCLLLSLNVYSLRILRISMKLNDIGYKTNILSFTYTRYYIIYIIYVYIDTYLFIY